MAAFSFIFILLVLLMVGAVVVAIGATATRAIKNANSPQLQSGAYVVAKRSEASGGGGNTSVSQRYYVTFELPDGQRAEFMVPGTEFGQLVEGDYGTVFWQGTRYRGFTRELLPPGPQDMPRLNA